MIAKIKQIEKLTNTYLSQVDIVYIMGYKDMAHLARLVHQEKISVYPSAKGENYYKLSEFSRLLENRIGRSTISRHDTLRKINDVLARNKNDDGGSAGQDDATVGIRRDCTLNEASRFLKIEQAIKERIQNDIRMDKLIARESIEKEFASICQKLWADLVDFVEQISLNCNLTAPQKAQAYAHLTEVLEKFKKEGGKIVTRNNDENLAQD